MGRLLDLGDVQPSGNEKGCRVGGAHFFMIGDNASSVKIPFTKYIEIYRPLRCLLTPEVVFVTK